MNNNSRKKEMALFIAAVSLALSVILLGGTGAFGQTLTTIHDFGSGNDGENPQAGVVFDQAGNLYGTAALGALNRAYSVRVPVWTASTRTRMSPATMPSSQK